jgi:hypothetical protein
VLKKVSGIGPIRWRVCARYDHVKHGQPVTCCFPNPDTKASHRFPIPNHLIPFTCMYVCVCACMYVCMYLCVCMYVCVCVWSVSMCVLCTHVCYVALHGRFWWFCPIWHPKGCWHLHKREQGKATNS